MTKKTIVDSPLGPLWLFATGDALVALEIPDHRSALDADTDDAHPILVQTKRWLDAYFASPHPDPLPEGERETRRNRARPDLPELPRLAPAGTPFQQAVWRAMLAIPRGETLSYGAIARALGRPNGARAVGMACGRNPIPIVIPCHRVVGTDGSLTGFGWGMPRKVWLLNHEGVRSDGRGGARGRLAQTGTLDLEAASTRAAGEVAR